MKAALTALLAIGLIASASQGHAEGVQFHIKNNTGGPIQVRFYSQSHPSTWPSAHSGYDFKNGEQHDFNLACGAGEKICYGAWTMPDEKTLWGVGINGKSKCSAGCCFDCGQNGTLITLSK